MSKQKELDADPRAIQKIGWHKLNDKNWMIKTNSQVCTVS